MSETPDDPERPSYEILLDKPPSLEGNTDAIDEARQLYSIYLAHRDKNGSTDPRGALLPFFVYQYDEDATEDDDAIGTIDLRNRRLPSINDFNRSVNIFFRNTDSYWSLLQENQSYLSTYERAKILQQDTKNRRRNRRTSPAPVETNDPAAAVEQLARDAAAQSNNIDGLIALFGQFITSQNEAHRQQLEALTGIKQKTNTSSDSRFRIDYVGVFYPDLTTEAAAASDVTTQGSTVIFRDVDLFLDSAQQAGYTHGNGLIAQHLHLCLRGSAATWYATIDIPTRVAAVPSYRPVTDRMTAYISRPSVFTIAPTVPSRHDAVTTHDGG
ncbi:hypothetical protein B0J12DRAFT_747327 [Macrophomina phaseolina]|uniref:Uncharacterized protein n=1 Tax=Macrophomina phaseolina TaxID=35725 RepID=A0ABQ8FQF1_9PEZI|nr:hypothetical protein B0J12DRAFT_747327 [Macrophomina phaseolina]